MPSKAEHVERAIFFTMSTTGCTSSQAARVHGIRGYKRRQRNKEFGKSIHDSEGYGKKK